MEPLRWTPYMDDCVRILTEKRETETKLDILLVTQVKCHQITDQLTYSYAEKTQGDGTKVPPAYFVKAMLQQLQDIRGSLPVELQSNSECLNAPTVGENRNETMIKTFTSPLDMLLWILGGAVGAGAPGAPGAVNDELSVASSHFY